MATVLSFSTAKSMIISLLQASQTAWASVVDGLQRQFASDSEISNAILTADGIVCSIIARTPLHPYQTQFVASPASIVDGANTPIRNGMILRVTGQMGLIASQTFDASSVNTTTDLITAPDHGYVTGTPVQVSNPGTLPSGLLAVTTYYIYRSSNDNYGFCTSIYNAHAGTLKDLLAQGSGTNTVTTNFTDIYQSDSKDTLTEMKMAPYLFSTISGGSVGFWFIEGDTFYTNCPACKLYYTDYTLTASPQAPEPYLFAVVAGAMVLLLKDGGPADEIGFYSQQSQFYLQEIASSSKMLPEIATYQQMAA